jgi:hypothetical protein
MRNTQLRDDSGKWEGSCIPSSQPLITEPTPILVTKGSFLTNNARFGKWVWGHLGRIHLPISAGIKLLSVDEGSYIMDLDSV